MLSKLKLSPARGWFTATHISLYFAGLMWVLPFLHPFHQYPLTTFYQEWYTVMLGLVAAVFLLNKQAWVEPQVPRIALLPLGLMVLVLVQFILGRLAYFDQGLLFALYMLWLIVLMLLGRMLRERLGLARMAAVLAVCLLLGSELGALAGVLQHYRISTFLDAYITAKVGIAVYGNVAQPNHYADYITLGLISLGFLGNRLRVWQTVILALPLLFVLVLSGSRSTWLYLLAMIAIAWFWQKRDPACKDLLRYALWLLPAFALMHWLVQLPWFSGATSSVTTVQRMMAGETSGSIRLYLWHEAWLIWSQFPLLGAGWGQFAWQHFQLSPSLGDPHINGLYNNAHNLVLQLATELGLAGALLLLWSLARWLWYSVKVPHARAHGWAYSLLAVLGIHSMLEYPLWYAYFLGIAALLLGALDVQAYRLQMRRFGRLSVAMIVVFGMISMLQLRYGYQLLEQALATLPAHANGQDEMQQISQKLAIAHEMPVLQPYTELYLNNYLEISPEGLEAKLELNDRLQRFVPIGAVVYRRVLLLALAGREDEAGIQIERAIWGYPAEWPAQQKVLEEWSQKDPAKFSALLKFAIQKHEEYASAISVK